MIFFLWFLSGDTFECKGIIHLRKFYSRSTKWRYQGDSQVATSCTIKLENFPFCWMSTESCVFARLLFPERKQSCWTTSIRYSPRTHGSLHPIRSVLIATNGSNQMAEKCLFFKICKKWFQCPYLLDYSSMSVGNCAKLLESDTLLGPMGVYILSDQCWLQQMALTRCLKNA